MRVKIKIDKERCKGCKLCIHFCPKNVIRMSKKINKQGLYFAEIANKENCTGCGLCYLMCPDVCIGIKKGEKMEAKRTSKLNHLLIIPDGDRRYARRSYLADLFRESKEDFRSTLKGFSERDLVLLEKRIEKYVQTGKDPFYTKGSEDLLDSGKIYKKGSEDLLDSGEIFVPQNYLFDSYRKGGEVFSSLIKWILRNDIPKVLSIYALQRRNLERSAEQVCVILKTEAEFFKLWADNKEIMSSCNVKFVGDQRIFDLYRDKEILGEVIGDYVNSIKLLETKSLGKKLKVYVLAPYDREWEIGQAVINGKFNPARLVVKEDVDLILRIGDAKTPTSGALPYQVAYSQFSYVRKYFPDFTTEIFQKVLEECGAKERESGL